MNECKKLNLARFCSICSLLQVGVGSPSLSNNIVISCCGGCQGEWLLGSIIYRLSGCYRIFYELCRFEVSAYLRISLFFICYLYIR